jgi:alpha-L-fucosidase
MRDYSRREFMQYGAGAAMAGRTCLSLGQDGAVSSASQESSTSELPKPTPAQIAWQDCEIGLVYHFDMSIAAGNFTGNNTARTVYDTDLYNPTKLDTDQWIEAAKACGAGYAVFTATHFNGFMQWQSELYPYGVKQAAWRDGEGDVVADFVESCRRADIKPGIYFSTHRNVYQTVWGHYVDWGKGHDTDAQLAYNRIAEQQFEELCTRYGDLAQIWFDAGVKLPHEGGPDMLPIFEEHQPDSVFYHSSLRSDHRWIGNEAGRVGYPCWGTMPEAEDGSIGQHAWRGKLGSGDPDGTVWSPGMADAPLRNHNWFWAPGQDHLVRSLDGLMDQYYKSVGHNCNLLLGEVVTSEGLVPEHDIQRLTEFGNEIRRRFEKPIAETSGRGRTVELRLPQSQCINHMIAMEEIAEGERIRRYTLEGLTSDNDWQTLCEGESIGHKRIQAFDDVEVAAVRLNVSEDVAEPIIRQLAVYDVT